MKNEHGFTLIEVMVVITIIGIMATLAVVAANPAAATGERWAARVHGLMYRAKGEAAVRNVPVGCQLNGNGAFCFVRRTADIGPASYILADGLVSAGGGDIGDVVDQVRFSPAADIDAVPATGFRGMGGSLGAQFFFLPDGMVVDALEAPRSVSFAISKVEGGDMQYLVIHSTGSIANVFH